MPEYPRQLLESGIEGECVVRMIVDTSGRPEPQSVTIVRMPHPAFEAALRSWVTTLEFRPAQAEGRSVRVLVDLPLRFSLRVPRGQETSATLLEAARAQLAASDLDSARTLLQRVAEAPARAVPDRLQAWVLLAVVGFYSSGDSAARYAFRQGLALDPGFQVAALDQFDPALAQMLAAERAALPAGAQPAPRPEGEPIHDCLRKCPEGVRPPQFMYFPQIEFQDDAGVRGRTSRMRTFLTFHAVVGADGVLEPESVQLAGGTARGTEPELRRGLAQARFQPGRADGVPVRTQVMLRFDFEAEGTNWIKYSYRVVAR